MKQTYISEISKHLGEEVTIKGWLYNKRSSGKLGFLEVRDGSGIIQGVVSKKDVSDETWENTEKVTQESSVIVRGAPREHPKKPGVYELDIKDLRIVQLASEYPITPKEHGVEFLMDHRHLWLRSRRQHAILCVRHEIIRAVRDFFDNNGFILCDTPIFTPAACEGTTTLFEASYFDE
jgi:asparaginyl-tRNA synthetase